MVNRCIVSPNLPQQGGAAHGGDRRAHGAGRRSWKCVAHGAQGRLFPGGHRIGDRHSAAIGAGKLMTQQLFSVRPWDPVMLASATLALGLAALLSSALPTWRAAGVEPMVALRNE
jgi:hypothetical protein